MPIRSAWITLSVRRFRSAAPVGYNRTISDSVSRGGALASHGESCSTIIASSSGSSPGTAASGPLKIGILVPFTESAIDADIGASQRRAADLYLKLKGGSLAGREVQLVYNDESSLDPSINKVRIQQFIEKDHVEMLMGGVAAPAAYLLHDTAEASKMVYLDTNAGTNALTRANAGCAPSCKSTYVFRTAPSSWQLSEPLGDSLSKGGQRDFFIVSADDAFGTESAAAFAEGLGVLAVVVGLLAIFIKG